MPAGDEQHRILQASELLVVKPKTAAQHDALALSMGTGIVLLEPLGTLCTSSAAAV